MNKANIGKHYLFNNKTGSIYPDFIGRDHQNRIIADAKYKPINNIKGSDYFQILAYMYRFDAKRGYLLYPEMEDNKQTILSLYKGTIYENKGARREEDICAIKHGLIIPRETGNYKAFVNNIKVIERALIEKTW